MVNGLLRCVFAAMALLALATEAARTPRAAAGPQSTKLDAGLAALGLAPHPSALAGVLAAEAPGCPEPVMLARIGFNGIDRFASRALLDGGAVPRFVYLGFVGSRMQALPIAARWAAAGALHALALRDDEAPGEVVLAALPRSCPGLQAMDWSRLSPWR